MIYFDNAATTYPKPEEVYVVMDQFYREYGVNAGRGSYKLGQRASHLIEDTRGRLAKLLGAKRSKSIVFTPSATIAINQVLQGIQWKPGDVVYYSPFEHNGTLRTLTYLQEKEDLILKRIPVDPVNLTFQFDKLEQDFVIAPPRLVIVSHVSNVCGLIAPVIEIANLTQEYGGEILVDAAQCAGLIPLPLEQVDYYIFAGHKSLYGPFGIAGLWINQRSAKLRPLIYGGTGFKSEDLHMPEEMPARFEAGSVNIQAVAGLNAALKWIEDVTSEVIFKHDQKITQMLMDMFKGFMDVKVFAPNDWEVHFNVVSIQVAGYTPQEFGKILDERFDIAVRTGLHCAPVAHELLGTSPLGTVRFGVGYFNTEEDISRLQMSLSEIVF